MIGRRDTLKAGRLVHKLVGFGDSCPIPDVCIDERRLPLFIARATLRDLIAGLPDTGLPEDEATPCAKRGRKALPANLLRERVEYHLADEQKVCPCCCNGMHRMGETVTEQLHIEVKAKVLLLVRFKYACRHCDRTGINTPVVMAPMPRQPLPGSIATASTLAFALVHKYVDGTPPLPPGAGLRARRGSCKPGGSGPLGDRRK